MHDEQRWHTMDEEPKAEYGWFLVFAPSADPDNPLRHMAFWSSGNDGHDKGWTGLVDHWMKHLTHWHPFPEDPK